MFSNYFAELASWVKLRSTAAPEGKVFSSDVGWQALRLTLPQDPRLLSEARTTMLALILSKRPLFFHWDKVTQVMRCLLVIDPNRRGLEQTMQRLLGF
jgi:hypothetical protein